MFARDFAGTVPVRLSASTVRPSSSTMRTHASAPLRGELRSWDTTDGIQKLFTRFVKWKAGLGLKKVLVKPSPHPAIAAPVGLAWQRGGYSRIRLRGRRRIAQPDIGTSKVA